MLSNTATPKYYGEFRQKVLDGEIPINEKISQQMNRIDKMIKNPRYYYDDSKVEGWISYCENELTLTDGSDFHMLDTFKLWGEDLLGWYEFVEKRVWRPCKNKKGGHYVTRVRKKRVRNKQYLIVARGASKTMYGHCHQSYGLTIDTSTTHGVTTAPTMKQAEEILSPFRTAIARARGPLFQFLTQGAIHNTKGSKKDKVKLASTKKGIQNFLTNSLLEIRPMTIGKLQGLRNKYSTVDEWLSTEIREDPIGALEQGASKIDDYWIIATSSEGTIRNGVGDSMKMELHSILKGEYDAANVSIWWYSLDDVKEVGFPELWVKANPNIGKTVSYETYEQDVERAENVPSARNDILAKRFGIPLEGYTYFFTYNETLLHNRKSFWKLSCSMGADLSQGDDFCAFTFLFPLSKERFGIKARAYITERTYKLLPLALKDKYREFLKERTLVIMPGTILNIMDVYDDLDQFIMESEYDVVCFGYDPYGAKEFVERWCSENGEHGVVKVPQGTKTESIPLGELKKMATDRLLLFDEEIMKFCMGNAIVLQDTNGGRKLYKRRLEEKIDNVAAMMDAYVAYKANMDMFD